MIKSINALLLFAFAVLVTGCQGGQSVTKRYEVIVTLKVDGEVFSGSAVWEAIIDDGWDVFFQYGPVNDVAGEAIEVRVAPGRSIFVLRRPASPPKDFVGSASLSYGAFVRNCIELDTADSRFMAVLAEFDGRCAISATPAMVRFTDPVDPTTIEIVEYGPGFDVELLGIHVASTVLPVTNSIESVLPWISDMQSNENIRTGTKDGNMSEGFYFISGQIYSVDFKKEHSL